MLTETSRFSESIQVVSEKRWWLYLRLKVSYCIWFTSFKPLFVIFVILTACCIELKLLTKIKFWHKLQWHLLFKNDTEFLICTFKLRKHFSDTGHLLDKKQQNKKAVEPYIIRVILRALSGQGKGIFYNISRLVTHSQCVFAESLFLFSCVGRVFAIVSKFLLCVCPASLKLLWNENVVKRRIIFKWIRFMAQINFIFTRDKIIFHHTSKTFHLNTD